VNRLFGKEERWARASSFAAAFQGGSWQATANESKISRWETSVLRVPRQAISRYEDLLGLVKGQLTSAADTVHDYYCLEPGCLAPYGRDAPRGETIPVARVETLIDKAASSDLMTGQEWHELSSVISSASLFFISPAARWATLAERVLQEQIIADGVPWLHRFGALSRLLRHPVGQQAAIDTCASLAADRSNQAGIEVICALDSTVHPDATRHVLTQLANPTSDSVFYGALLACVRKLARGHFTSRQADYLASVAAELLDSPDSYLDSRILAASLLRQMPEGLPARVASQLSRALATDEALSPILRTGSVAHPRVIEDLVGPVVTAAAARMPRDGPWPYDETLATLVEEMLYRPNADVRLFAAVLIRATPYRAPVASALTRTLTRMRLTSHPDLAACILDAFRLIGTAAQRPMAESLVLHHNLPPQITIAAARNIGHIGGTSPDQFWAQAIDTYARRWRRHSSPADGAIIRGLIYGLGITGNDTLLNGLQRSPGLPPEARKAASWWLNQPQTIRQSATL
jgi:hypothetical protein